MSDKKEHNSNISACYIFSFFEALYSLKESTASDAYLPPRCPVINLAFDLNKNCITVKNHQQSAKPNLPNRCARKWSNKSFHITTLRQRRHSWLLPQLVCEAVCRVNASSWPHATRHSPQPKRDSRLEQAWRKRCAR